jgi:acetyl esterase/lipase
MKHTDIDYREGKYPDDYAASRCRLNLQIPDGVENFTTIVWFHGGGIQDGDKDNDETQNLIRFFTASGYCAAPVNYRLYPEARYPDFIDDAAAAFAWIANHIKDHGGNPDSLFLSGHSAGAYIAAMVGIAPQFLKAYGVSLDQIRGVIPISGQVMNHARIREEYNHDISNTDIHETGPCYYASKDAPPFLCLWGDNDLEGRREENLKFTECMKKSGNRESRCAEINHRDHLSIIHKLPEPRDPAALFILEFIEKHKTRPQISTD